MGYKVTHVPPVLSIPPLLVDPQISTRIQQASFLSFPWAPCTRACPTYSQSFDRHERGAMPRSKATTVVGLPSYHCPIISITMFVVFACLVRENKYRYLKGTSTYTWYLYIHSTTFLQNNGLDDMSLCRRETLWCDAEQHVDMRIPNSNRIIQ